MKHDIQWFLDHITSKKTIKRTTYDTKTDKTRTSYQRIENEKQAEYLFGLQSDYISFADNIPSRSGKVDDPFESDKPIIRVHKTGLADTCISCEAWAWYNIDMTELQGLNVKNTFPDDEESEILSTPIDDYSVYDECDVDDYPYDE